MVVTAQHRHQQQGDEEGAADRESRPSRPLLDEADLESFCHVLPLTQPCELSIVSNRDEWHELSNDTWRGACQAIGECSETLQSFEFCTLYCRPGYKETKLVALVPHLPTTLNELTITDGLYAYAETFRAMALHLTHLETLKLRNSALGVPLEHDACHALAQLIRSLPLLRRVELASLKFQSEDDWNVVWEALASRDRLEDATFHRLLCAAASSSDDATSASASAFVDMAPSAQKHPHLTERRAVLNLLRRRHPPDTAERLLEFTESQHLDALLFVRTDGRLSLDKIRREAGHPADARLGGALAALTDRPDLSYRLLRHEADPAVWTRGAIVVVRTVL